MKNISVTIQDIKETGYSYKPLPADIEIAFGLNLKFGLGFQFDIDADNEIFKLSTKVNYVIDGYEEDFLNFSNTITFKISNLKNAFINEEGDHIKINDDLIVSLAAVCIGTTRGLLAANTKGSDWAKYPVPILDPKQVVKQMNKLKDEK